MSPSMIKYLTSHPELSFEKKTGVVYDGRWPVIAGGIDSPPYDGRAAKLASKASKAKWAELFALPIEGKTESQFCQAAKAAGF